ncbi:MAG TPA: hypothetical protein VFX16_06525 [Pseudonocardiaceae bacterium]|nr:hypothetical protein [Pseudonocardiaceae bacterium]
MARSPFADVVDGPAEDAVVIELGGLTRVALGCFTMTTVFLALLALAALGYAVLDHPAAPALRAVAAVLGALFALMVVGLAIVAIRAARHRQGLAFDADAVWCRPERTLVRLPWPELAMVRVVPPRFQKGVRTSAPRTPTVELCPADEAVVRRYPALADSVTSGEPVRADLPVLRFAFPLSCAADEPAVAAAVARFAPDRWPTTQS